MGSTLSHLTSGCEWCQGWGVMVTFGASPLPGPLAPSRQCLGGGRSYLLWTLKLGRGLRAVATDGRGWAVLPGSGCGTTPRPAEATLLWTPGGSKALGRGAWSGWLQGWVAGAAVAHHPQGPQGCEPSTGGLPGCDSREDLLRRAGVLTTSSHRCRPAALTSR